MTDADNYRRIAGKLLEAAKSTADSAQRATLTDRALSYLRLAEMAEKNQMLDLTYETPMPPAPVAQQQQQIQPKKDSEK